MKRKIPFKKIIDAARLSARSGGFRPGLFPGLMPPIAAVSPLINMAISAAKSAIDAFGGKRNLTLPRVIQVPVKSGGILLFIAIFAGLSALGALSGGAAGIAKALNAANAAKRELEKAKRHNEKMEAIALGKGFYLQRIKKKT